MFSEIYCAYLDNGGGEIAFLYFRARGSRVQCRWVGSDGVWGGMEEKGMGEGDHKRGKRLERRQACVL